MASEHDDGFEPHHASSPTDHVLTELQLYGYRPFQDEPDPRPLPEGNIVAGAIADIFDALIATLGDTRLEPDLDDLLWSAVNLFHRAADRLAAPKLRLDQRAAAPAASAANSDGVGGEVGRTGASHRRRAHTDRAPQRIRADARPGRRAFRAPHRILLAATQRIDGQSSHPDLGHDRQPRLPRRQAPSRDRGVAAGGTEDRLYRRARFQRPSPDLGDSSIKVHAKHPDMVLLHGGSPKGAELHRRTHGPTPARCRRSPSSPTGPSHAKAAPFKRNDSMLAVLPIGVMVFPGLRHHRKISPTRPARWASRSSISGRKPPPRHDRISADARPGPSQGGPFSAYRS